MSDTNERQALSFDEYIAECGLDDVLIHLKEQYGDEFAYIKDQELQSDPNKKYFISCTGSILVRVTFHVGANALHYKRVPIYTTDGYLEMHFQSNHKQHTKKIHWLVACTYLDTSVLATMKHPTVQHKDHVRTNNNPSNLEFIEHSDNASDHGAAHLEYDNELDWQSDEFVRFNVLRGHKLFRDHLYNINTKQLYKVFSSKTGSGKNAPTAVRFRLCKDVDVYPFTDAETSKRFRIRSKTFHALMQQMYDEQQQQHTT